MNAHVKNRLHMYRRFEIFFLFVFVLPIISACSKPTIIIIKNNSPVNIIVLFKDGTHNLRKVSILPKANAEIENLLDKHFSIYRSSEKLDYAVEVVPEEFILDLGTGPFFKRSVKANFESDSCIYLISNHKASLTSSSVQPVGFPLCPNR